MINEARTAKPYALATRNGPAGSGIIRRFVDRYSSSYGGTEIPWSITLKEHRSAKEKDLIKHLLTRLRLRPMDEDAKNTDGYDENGYRDAQQISVYVYVNGDIAETDVTNNVPVNGDNTFGEQVVDYRIAFKITGTASELKIASANTDYEVLEQRGNPIQRTMTEHVYQEEFAAPLAWFSAGSDKTLNRATGVQATGSVFGSTMGPDGQTGSAIVFSNTSVLVSALRSTVSGNYTAMFSVSSIVSSVEICRIGTAIIRVNRAGSVYSLILNDNGVDYAQILTWKGVGWVTLRVTRSGQNLIMSENGEQIFRMPLSAINTYAATVTFSAANPKYLFDFRLDPAAISAEAVTYYYQDVTERNGNATIGRG